MTSWELTGNHYLSVPCISMDDGGVHRVGVLHRGLLGALEWAGGRELDGRATPLLVPRFRIDGEPAPIQAIRWERVDRWIPRFRAEIGEGVRVIGTLCIPGSPERRFHGGVYELRVENQGTRDRRVEIALEGSWAYSLRDVRSSRPLQGRNALAIVPEGVVLEAGEGLGGAALAVLGGARTTIMAAADAEPEPLEGDAELRAENGVPLRFRLARSIRVTKGGRAGAAFFLGVAPERDGALAHAAALRSAGAESLVQDARLDIARLERRLSDPGLSALLNRHLCFAYYFGIGRAVDDDRLYPVRSRSPLFAGGATVSERDVLLWTLPALTLADPETAREVLLRCFEQYSHDAGRLAHYLDGGSLEPGFVLDHYCAYIVALDRYSREAADSTVLAEPPVQDVLRELDAGLFSLLDASVFLAATELTPTGEGPEFPFVVPANVLFWKACEALPRLWVASDPADVPKLREGAEEIADAIWRHAVAEVAGLRVLAWAVDLEGGAAVYDDPEASLLLLPGMGFCDADEPVWRNTVELLHSGSYPYRIADAAFPGRAARSAPALPTVAALCAELRGAHGSDALAILRRLPTADGVLGEAYDPADGATRGQRHWAALAALVAQSIWDASEHQKPFTVS